MGSWRSSQGLALGLATFVSLLSASALAQEASAADVATARRLFGEGLAALEEERWEDARDAFSRSHELVPRPNTLLNLATAQAEMNLPVEAIESYRAFIEQATRRQRRHVRDAEREIAELEARIAHVELTIPDLESGDVVRLDDQDLTVDAMQAPLSLSPGRHVVVVLRSETSIGRVELVLVEGETRGVELALHPPAPVVETPLLIETVDEGSDDVAIGVGVGVALGVALIAAGVVLGVVLTQPEDLYVGNFGPGMVTF